MMTVGVLICLITLTSQLVHSKVITINITSGNSSLECCTEERCMCASLAIALQHIDSNTTINITSSPVMLEESVKLGSGNLTNITITGSNVTIMCNNSGSVYCELCDDVKIEGITWDRCGDPNGTNIAGVTFNGTSNISLVNCTFQHSMHITAVHFLQISGTVSINNCNFLSNYCEGLLIHNSTIVYFSMSDSYFYNNGFYCVIDTLALDVYNDGSYSSYPSIWYINITKTIFLSNMDASTFHLINSSSSIYLQELVFNNNGNAISTSLYGTLAIELLYGSNSTVSLVNSLFSDNIGAPLSWDVAKENKAEIMIVNSTFTNNQQAFIALKSSVVPLVWITMTDVEISHGIMPGIENKGGNVLISFLDDLLPVNYYKTVINLTRVSVISNQYLGDLGGTVYIEYSILNHLSSVTFQDCEFYNNTSNRGSAFCIINNYNGYTTVNILNSKIHHNIGSGSVIYVDSNKVVDSMIVIVISSNFTNNVGSSMRLLYSHLICQSAVFANNTADNGAAIYIDQGSVAYINNGENVQFINNSAAENGGAIFANLFYICALPVFTSTLSGITNSVAMFVNNTAKVSGNSIYFYIPAYCKVDNNISSFASVMYSPCQFSYFQPVNGKMVQIPCNLDYILLNGTGAPIVTSPHELRLYFPFNDGYNKTISNCNVYFIKNNILGYPVKFAGNVFDYFKKPAEPTQFFAQCVNCSSSIVLPKTLLLVDNITFLSVTFTGAYIENRVNVNLTLTSTVHSIKEITAILVVELIPCIDHPGYTYSTAHKACECYHHNVDCHDSYNEIKRGYWFGNVSNTTTTVPCHHYCKFTGRTETRQGYFELPSTIDGQCNDHRVGRACGECSSGYTLSFDSTDCISVDQCGTGWTVLVITLTCLYWIAIVVGVFALMYFKFQISLGYLYGLIYYYSLIRILLDNNPYFSDGVFQFTLVLSSFAQLTPQFLGKLCFVEGLSGIDQLFIHYSHAVGVSLLLLLIVVAARWSTKVTLFVSRCIIRVICLLILLSYTSIVSTSLQLLQPLRFTDVKEWYTYTSPTIQYFHGRHVVYGVVAIICELVVGIGLPLLLLLQPFLSRKIDFIRIKPLLDQFQGCYKDKYRWFAAYYLICRQVIIVTVYSFNSNYYNMIFYLQSACVVIASIHIWIQPYKSALLNGSDGVMLLLMIQANGFVFVDDSTFLIVGTIIVSLPLILLTAVFITKAIYSCRKKRRHYRFVNINNADADDEEAAEENIIRR